MSDSKICPDCNKQNSSGNLRCVKCNTSPLNVPLQTFWKEDENPEGINAGVHNIFLKFS